MADYHTLATRECTSVDNVGVGLGDAPDGSTRVCVMLEGPAINPHLDPSWQGVNWMSLTPAAAKELHKLLDSVKHTFEDADDSSPALRALLDRMREESVDGLDQLRDADHARDG